MQSKYKSEYPELLIKTFEGMGDICHFCVKVKIGRATFYEWLKAHPEFAEAYSKCQEIQEVLLMDAGIKGMQYGSDFNYSAWQLFMRNKCGYTAERRVKLNLRACKTADEKVKVVEDEVSDGKFTASEARALTEMVNTSASIHEKTEVAKDVEELKATITRK